MCRSRGIGTGIAASLNYVLGFVARKTYYDMETTLSLAGVSLLYCIISGIGVVLMYFVMPETEGRTLEDIELHFSDDSKKITDRIIAKSHRSSTKPSEQNTNSVDAIESNNCLKT